MIPGHYPLFIIACDKKSLENQGMSKFALWLDYGYMSTKLGQTTKNANEL